MGPPFEPAQGPDLPVPKTARMFSIELDRTDYDLRQIVRGVFRFQLPEERANLKVAVGLTAMREGEIVFEATRTLDGPKTLSSGTYSFELRLPEEVKGPGFMKRVKQVIKRSGAAPVEWEVWGILDREIVCKRGLHVEIEEEDDEPPAPSPESTQRAAAAASVMSRLNIPPPDYSPSGRADLADKGKKKKPAPEPGPKLKDMSEYARSGKICAACGAREDDPESEYCGRCGKSLA